MAVLLETTISRVHLSPDQSTLTVHFVNGTLFAVEVGTDQERRSIGEFLARLSQDGRGFLSSGRELLNLRSAVWVSIPDEGPVQVRWQDNRTHSLSEVNVDHVRTALEP